MRRSYLEQYRTASYLRGAIWNGLLLEGDLEEGTPLWEDTYAVARETMTLARRNVEIILEFLRGAGYLFCGVIPGVAGEPAEPWLPPGPDTPALLEQLTDLVGPIPLSLRAWWEIVGAVSLRGKFGDTEQTLPMNDPLVVEPLDWVIGQVQEEMDSSDRKDESHLAIDLAPDLFHKADVSGGAPYQMRVPDRHADGRLRNVTILLPLPPNSRRPYRDVETNETFVGYLRRSFEWAGFPGYAFLPSHQAERLRPLVGKMEDI